MLTRSLRLPEHYRLSWTVGPLLLGRSDPTARLAPDGLVRSGWTEDGAATLIVRVRGDRAECEAHGPGAAATLDALAGLLGLADDPEGLATTDPAVVRLIRRARGLRLPRTGRVADVLVPTIVAQRVTGLEAKRSWSRIVRRWGRPAPGPVDGLWLPPTPAELAAHAYHEFHPLGVERSRAVTITRACARIGRLEESVAMDTTSALTRLTALPGLGAWTAAIVRRLSAGDPDTVEVGDYHLKNAVAWNLAGRARGDDAGMLELLAPFAGQRGRVVRLVEVAGAEAPAFGPRHRLRPVDVA